MRRNSILSFTTFLALAGWAAPAHATTMTFAFEGIVDDVVDWSHVITQYVHIGDTLSGTCTIDLDATDIYPEYDYGAEYPGAVVGLQGQVGDLTFSLDTPETSNVSVTNDAPPLNINDPGPWDRYQQGADVVTSVVGYDMRLSFTLMDESGTAFDPSMGDSLPAEMPPLEAFHRPGIGHGFGLRWGGDDRG